MNHLTVAASVALLVGLVACRSSANLSPKQMDDIHAGCAAGIASGSTATAHADPEHLGFRAQRDPAGTPVVIYGASWCDACSAAASYLARWHIPYVEKDVEKEAAAHAMLLATLASVRMKDTGALPVIDVRGAVMTGFSPCLIEETWAAP